MIFGNGIPLILSPQLTGLMVRSSDVSLVHYLAG